MDLKTIYYSDYSGGLNDTSSDREIKPDEASILRNWEIKYQGQLRRRNGLTQVGNTISTNPIVGMGAFLQSNSAKDLLAFEGTNLSYLNGTTWATLTNTLVSGHKLWMENVMALNKIFISNEDNALAYWDRSSTVLNSALTVVSGAPRGNILRWHKNHLFVINNVTVGSTLYPHDAFFSNLGDPLTFDTTNNHFQVPGNGRLITCIDLGDSLILFKEKAIQYLSGFGANSWKITETSSAVANLDEQVGICGAYAVTRVGNEAWFMDDRGQIRRIFATDATNDTFRKDIISKNIQGTLASLNKTALAGVIAWTHNDQVFFAVPQGTSTTNNLVLVFDILAANRTNQEAWTTYTGWAANVFMGYPTSVVSDLYVGDASTGKVYVHSGVSDNGVAIEADWQSKNDDFKAPERYKNYKFGYGSGQTTGSANVLIFDSVDQGPFAQTESLNLSSSSGSRLGPTGSFRLGPTGNARLSGAVLKQSKFYYTSGGGSTVGKNIKHRIYHNVLGEQPTVNGFSTHFRPRSLR